LADARDKLGTGDVFQENTRRFHEYLQGRFDFIARAIDDTQDPPEPVWFVRDLLEGFLRQTAYLGLAEFRLRAFRARQGPRSQPAPPSAGDPVLLLEAD
jgi:hypothetical protein